MRRSGIRTGSRTGKPSFSDACRPLMSSARWASISSIWKRSRIPSWQARLSLQSRRFLRTGVTWAGSPRAAGSLCSSIRNPGSGLSWLVAWAFNLSWSRDSRQIYFQDVQQGREQPILRVLISDLKVEQIASRDQLLRTDVRVFSLTGIAPDGSPLVTIIRSRADAYALYTQLP